MQIDRAALAAVCVRHVVAVALVLLRLLSLLLQVGLAERQGVASLFRGDGAVTLPLS